MFSQTACSQWHVPLRKPIEEEKCSVVIATAITSSFFTTLVAMRVCVHEIIFPSHLWDVLGLEEVGGLEDLLVGHAVGLQGFLERDIEMSCSKSTIVY